jgi:F0F1-type ATP synthase gamma subunit
MGSVFVLNIVNLLASLNLLDKMCLHEAVGERSRGRRWTGATLMQAAEKNIEERLDELHGAFNQLRQSAITEELLDVVTGFEALSKGRRTRRQSPHAAAAT